MVVALRLPRRSAASARVFFVTRTVTSPVLPVGTAKGASPRKRWVARLLAFAPAGGRTRVSRTCPRQRRVALAEHCTGTRIELPAVRVRCTPRLTLAPVNRTGLFWGDPGGRPARSRHTGEP